ncbi:sulfurtransferase TusA family protein [Kangiella sp. TOML190]|uniref:sulfurtransferase TusA family protein n=1 Tax=Kangiella sp. TOML190 TaxID=2931351 RepID=UPI00204009E8|nr:sulfurtransferase TusA family protein [Kangiella sp. TOML190]
MGKLSQAEFQQLQAELTVSETLNCSRLLCPMPVIKTQNQLKTMASGDILKVICTDPGTMADIPTWSRINAIEVLGYAELDDHTIEFLLKA